MKYNKGDLNNTIKVAQILASRAGKSHYVFATGYGYRIATQVPPFALKYYLVNPNGEVLHGAGIL